MASAGTLYYDIEMDVRGLLQGQEQINARLNSMERGFNNTGRAVNSAERSMSSAASTMTSLSRVATSLMAILSAQQVSQYADAWTTVNNKLSNALRPNEQLVDVTERVFNITQQTRGSLDATASLYARLERATRQYGTSAADLAKLTTIINQGFVVSGATAQEAENAIIQLSQGLASGALRGEEFNSVNEQGNRLIVALADSMGVTIGQMRALAAEGKLTTDVIVNGLLSQGATIGDEFAKTTATISQALQVAGNNITKFFGENSTVKSGVAVFNSAIISISENISGLGTALTAVAAVMGSRYVGALTMATAAKFKAIVASRNQAAAENQAAQATAVRAAADLRAATAAKSRALDEIRLAEMMRQTAYSAESAAAAEARLSAARVAAAGAVDNYNRALVANRAAQSALSSGVGLLSRGLGLIGGPAGAAMLAASAILYFSQRAKEARDDANKLADSVNELSSKFQAMSHTELAATIANMSQKLPELGDAVSEAQKDFDSATAAVERQQREIANWGTNTTRGRQAAEALGGAQDRLAIASLELEKAQNRLSQTQNAINIGRATLNGTFQQGIDLLRRDSEAAGVAAGMMNHLGKMIGFATSEKEKFNATSLMVERSGEGDKLLSNLEKQNDLLAITDKRQRAVAAARQQAMDAGVAENSNQLRQIEEAAARNYDLQQSEKGVSKGKKSTASSANEAATALARQSEILDRLNTGYKEGSLELAKYDAVKALGNKATQQQIADAERYAEAQWKAQAATKAATDAEQKRNQAKQNFTGLQGQVSPVAAADNSYQQQIAQLNEYVALYPQKIAEAEAVRAAIEGQYREQRVAAMWHEWSQQNAATQAAAAAFDSFGNNASNALTGIITGSMDANQALQSIGNTVLNSLVNTFVQMGVEWVKSAVTGSTAQIAATAATTSAAVAGTATTTAASVSSAAATTAAWTPAAIVASIGSFGGAAAIGIGAVIAAMAMSSSLAGKRKNGGPVSAGSMYQVGESGLPEIYQASNGSQYMIPGDNGKVISNKDLTSGSGSATPVTINIQNYTGATVDAQASQDGNGVTIDMIVADLNNGGRVSQAIQQNHQAPRKARS